MNNIKRYCYYILLIVAMATGYSHPSHANGCNFPKENQGASCSFPQVFIHHCTDFVQTAATGGPSTYFTPLIKVQYRGCGMGISDDGDATITVGKPYRMKDFTYLASIEIRKEVCDKVIPNDLLNLKTNDPKLYAFYNKMCNDYGGIAVGICSYYSKLPNFLSDAMKFFQDHTWSIALSPAWYIIAKNMPHTAALDGYGLIDCFPVPMAPLPPPFCDKPLDLPQKVDLFRICKKDETAIIEIETDDKGNALASDEHDVCVLPSQEQNYSTYLKPCIRLTFDVKTPLTNTQTITNTVYPNKPLPKGSFISIAGGPPKESLYQAPWQQGAQTILRQTKVYNTATTSFFSDPQFWGYNDGDFIDLCYDYLSSVGQGGSITESSNVNPAKRTFQVIRDCENQGGSCSLQDPSGDRQICVKEFLPNRGVSYHGCVPRPLPPKPTVSFCPHANTKSNACFQFYIDPAQQKWNTCHYLDGAGLTCGITNSQYHPIFTNKCFDLPKGQEALCVQYDCTTSGAKTTTACPSVTGALSFDGASEKATSGATKLCLQGYPSEISQPWCANGCNRICTKTQPVKTIPPTTPPPYFPSFSLMDRLDPPFPSVAPNPPEAYPLPDNSFCPFTVIPHDTPPPTPPISAYRIRNPIEDDVCVDVFLFDFIPNCGSLKDPKDQEKCKAYQEMCLQEQQSADGYNKHYTNFDQCNADYIGCVNSKWAKCPSPGYNCCNYFKRPS